MSPLVRFDFSYLACYNEAMLRGTILPKPTPLKRKKKKSRPLSPDEAKALHQKLNSTRER
jgi:uncharacterized protein (DUF2384 family)